MFVANRIYVSFIEISFPPYIERVSAGRAHSAMSTFSAALALAFLQSCVFGFSGAAVGDEGLKSERELKRDIFSDYDKLVRPVRKYSTSVPVIISLSPLAVRELNDKSQVLTLDSWIYMKWNDEYLRWQPSDYDGISTLRIAHTEVWKPDVTVYTSLTDAPMSPSSPTQALVYSNGTVYWVPPFTIHSRCSIPFSKVPKDVVECNIRFGSWTYDAGLMDIQLLSEKVDLSYFADNNIHWKLVKVVAGRQDKYYPCCAESYPHVDYNITLMRRWTARQSGSSETNGVTFA